MTTQVEDKPPNDSICMLAWDSVAIRPFSTAMPCCRFRPVDRVKFKEESNVHMDFRNSDSWRNLRQNMLAGIKVPECSQCYRDEASGSGTPRTQETRKIWPTTTDVHKLRFLEIAFSNLCNLACVSCNSSFSSTWGVEDHKKGRLDKPKVLVEHNSNLDSLDLSELKVLKIIGGEPFMDQDRFINLLERLDLSKIKLLVSTNGTVLPNEKLKSLIDKCNELVLEVSLDGVGTVNEWYRWPTKMNKIEEVMDQYQEWWGLKPKFQLRTHSVVHAYNIWNLDELVKYMINRYPTWKTDFDWIQNPAWQAICIIPNEHKEELKKKLTYWNDTIKGNWVYYKESPFLVSIDRLDDTERSSWKVFKENSLLLAEERNLNLLELVPILKDVM
jgi:sulfatase maturation enzyme AslB (radical SAM superfamily)